MVYKFCVSGDVLMEFGVETKSLMIFGRILLTIVSSADYCGDGHSCPGD
jgi:hypothetical protein